MADPYTPQYKSYNGYEASKSLDNQPLTKTDMTLITGGLSTGFVSWFFKDYGFIPQLAGGLITAKVAKEQKKLEPGDGITYIMSDFAGWLLGMIAVEMRK